MTNTPKTNKLDELELQKRKVEIEKIELEKEKIALESAELKKKFWRKNPQFWGFWTTVVAALGSFVFLWFNGNFEVKAERLKIEIANFTNEKKVVQDSIVLLRNSLKTFSDSLRTISDSLNIKRSEIELLQRQIKDGNRIKNALNSDIKSRDQIIANINQEKQENESKLNDTIQKLKNESRDLFISRKNAVDFMNNAITRTSSMNIQREEANRKYLECLVSNKKLSEENEALKKKNQ